MVEKVGHYGNEFLKFKGCEMACRMDNVLVIRRGQPYLNMGSGQPTIHKNKFDGAVI